VWIGVFVAATIGASVGVLAALTHNSAEESVPPAPEHPAIARSGSGGAPGSSATATSPATVPATTAPAAAVTPIATTITPAQTKTVARVESPNPVRRRTRHDGDDMPMTVVPADPPAQKIVAHPLPVTSTAPKVISQPGAPQPSTSQPPAPQPPAPQPSAPQPSADEPPPAPPPPANDPTTLPPPTAAN
jgi:hypothetical protein